MLSLRQKLVPGIVGISTYVDCVYHRELQLAATRATGASGPVNQLKVVTVTLDFDHLIANLKADRLDAAGEQVAEASAALKAAGSDFIVVTSGTTSMLTQRARQRVSLPFLGLAEAAWKEVAAHRPTRVGLLSTRHAAAGGIFQAVARANGAELAIPPTDTAARVDEVIFDELVFGGASAASLRILRDAVSELVAHGADTIILGNTDMTLVAERLREAAAVPLVDSARAHAGSAARLALDGQS